MLKVFAKQVRDCHGVFIALAEKQIPYNFVKINKKLTAPELQWLHSHTKFPVLIDQHVVVYDPRIILEYIDERYPHPPLMPIEPTARAHCRLLLDQIHKITITQLPELEEALGEKEFFLGKHYSLIDIYLTPFLSQNFNAKKQLFSKLPNLTRYIESLMSRDSFAQTNI